MRTFNVRLAAILLAIAVVFCVGVYFLHGWQVKRNASIFKDAAERAEKKAAEAAKKKDASGEQEANEEAMKCLGWYVQLQTRRRRSDGETRADVGQAILRRKQPEEPSHVQNAYSLLERTVRQAPDRQAARRELVKMAMLPQVRRFQDAKEHLEGFLLKESPKDPELLELLGQCQAQLGDYNLALETLQEGDRERPGPVHAYVQLAGLLRYHLSRAKEADQWMDELVKANPKSAKAHLLRGEYLLTIDGMIRSTRRRRRPRKRSNSLPTTWTSWDWRRRAP